MQLPAGAQTWISCGYDSAWTQAEHIAALLFDVAQIANWQRTDGKGPKPKPMARPGDQQRAVARTDSIAEKAKAFQSRQATPPPPPSTTRKRDARGRFVKEA